jgi:UDP-N-acetylglucosamine diphosphorylase/glucosamine-1-phosphate N-acetyltransferase
MDFVLFDDDSHLDLLPLTFTRPIAHLRVGALTLAEKWAHHLKAIPQIHAWGHLNPHFRRPHTEHRSLFLNAKFIPSQGWISAILDLCQPGTLLISPSLEVVAFQTKAGQELQEANLDLVNLRKLGLKELTFTDEIVPAIRFPWDIFLQNRQQIIEDFELIKVSRQREEVHDKYTAIYGKDNIWVEPGVKIRAAILNAEDGPIYIGQGAEIQEGAILHGAHAICPKATINMGAKLRGDSTIGPFSKVGGEIANSVVMGYSNKGHDGYLGNSVLGHWCNLGADTNTSNLKNNYAEVRVWNYRKQSFVKTGQMFCGLIMGDHSKCGINTMFNTGTVVGVSANIFGDGYPRNFIPSFAWGGAAGFSTFGLNKAFEVAEAVMKRRNLPLDEKEKAILTEVFKQTAIFRNWERENTTNHD